MSKIKLETLLEFDDTREWNRHLNGSWSSRQIDDAPGWRLHDNNYDVSICLSFGDYEQQCRSDYDEEKIVEAMNAMECAWKAFHKKYSEESKRVR